MRLRTRVEGGGTARLTRWVVDSEYGRLREVPVGPIDHLEWQPGSAVAQRSERGAAVHCMCQALKRDSAGAR